MCERESEGEGERERESMHVFTIITCTVSQIKCMYTSQLCSSIYYRDSIQNHTSVAKCYRYTNTEDYQVKKNTALFHKVTKMSLVAYIHSQCF